MVVDPFAVADVLTLVGQDSLKPAEKGDRTFAGKVYHWQRHDGVLRLVRGNSAPNKAEREAWRAHIADLERRLILAPLRPEGTHDSGHVLDLSWEGR